MRKIIVTEFITLDGVVEAPGGDETSHPNGGWQSDYGDPAVEKYKADELVSVDAFLLGKNTFQFFSGYWPSQVNNFADRMNQLPKYVVSTSIEKTTWNNSHILRDMANEVADLKKKEGGAILVYGSATLAKGLLHHNLVDELRLIVYPVTIGGGLRLFDDNREQKKLALKDSQVLSNGVIILEYQLNQ